MTRIVKAEDLHPGSEQEYYVITEEHYNNGGQSVHYNTNSARKAVVMHCRAADPEAILDGTIIFTRTVHDDYWKAHCVHVDYAVRALHQPGFTRKGQKGC